MLCSDICSWYWILIRTKIICFQRSNLLILNVQFELRRPRWTRSWTSHYRAIVIVKTSSFIKFFRGNINLKVHSQKSIEFQTTFARTFKHLIISLERRGGEFKKIHSELIYRFFNWWKIIFFFLFKSSCVTIRFMISFASSSSSRSILLLWNIQAKIISMK